MSFHANPYQQQQQPQYQQQGAPSPGLAPSPGPPQGQHLPGQQEIYTSTQSGLKAELSNPKGRITCGDLSITIDGELVPVIDVQLGQNLPIYFEHHITLWKSPSVSISYSRFSGAFRRFFGGMQILQTEARGPGNISFSRDSVGQIVCLRLAPGQAVDVREHQFCLATSNIDYQVTTFSGMSNIMFSRTGLLIDQFSCQHGSPHDGVLVLHGYGNVFEKYLQPGEALDIEPGAWLWKDPSCSMETINVLRSQGSHNQQKGFFNKVASGIAAVASGGGSLFMNRIVGPGRVGIQSMTYHPPAVEGAPAAGGSSNLGGFVSQLR